MSVTEVLRGLLGSGTLFQSVLLTSIHTRSMSGTVILSPMAALTYWEATAPTPMVLETQLLQPTLAEHLAHALLVISSPRRLGLAGRIAPSAPADQQIAVSKLAKLSVAETLRPAPRNASTTPVALASASIRTRGSVANTPQKSSI